MAKAGDETITWIWLREAKGLVVEAYGDPELAERLLREWFADGTVHWTHKRMAYDNETPKPTPSGVIGNPAFWRPIDHGRAGISRVEADFEKSRAWHEIKYPLFVIGPGVTDEPENPPLPAVWGIEVSREELLAQIGALGADATAVPLPRPQTALIRGGQAMLAYRILRKLYPPDGLPPDEKSVKQVTAEIESELQSEQRAEKAKNKTQQPLQAPGRDTVARVLRVLDWRVTSVLDWRVTP